MNILIDEPYTYDEITFNGWSSIYLLWSVRHTDNILIINAREFKKCLKKIVDQNGCFIVKKIN